VNDNPSSTVHSILASKSRTPEEVRVILALFDGGLGQWKLKGVRNFDPYREYNVSLSQSGLTLDVLRHQVKIITKRLGMRDGDCRVSPYSDGLVEVQIHADAFERLKPAITLMLEAARGGVLD
jgi:hypothetical protein